MNMKEKKIVCIVSIEAQKIDGSIHNTLIDVYGQNLTQLDFYNNFLINLSNKNRYKYLIMSKSEISLVENIKSSDNWEIVFVADNKVDFNDRNVFNNNALVMYHSFPPDTDKRINDLENFYQIVIKKRKGCHENYRDGGYIILNDLINAYNNENNQFDPIEFDKAKNELIKWFYPEEMLKKLNKALEFLHSSLGGEVADIKSLQEIGFNLNAFFEHEKEQKTLEEWINNCIGKKDNAYLQALAIVRDALLKQAGVE